jgi:5-methylcytosine-specific restriction endonuclease McrA
MERAGHCCSFVAEDGTPYASKWDLEIDHIEPRALGGSDEIGNLRVLCRAHNLMAAEGVFGSGYMRRFTSPAAGRIHTR